MIKTAIHTAHVSMDSVQRKHMHTIQKAMENGERVNDVRSNWKWEMFSVSKIYYFVTMAVAKFELDYGFLSCLRFLLISILDSTHTKTHSYIHWTRRQRLPMVTNLQNIRIHFNSSMTTILNELSVIQRKYHIDYAKLLHLLPIQLYVSACVCVCDVGAFFLPCTRLNNYFYRSMCTKLWNASANQFLKFNGQFFMLRQLSMLGACIDWCV